jgi:GTP-binding protein EngB required for normal cell division
MFYMFLSRKSSGQVVVNKNDKLKTQKNSEVNFLIHFE